MKSVLSRRPSARLAALAIATSVIVLPSPKAEAEDPQAVCAQLFPGGEATAQECYAGWDAPINETTDSASLTPLGSTSSTFLVPMGPDGCYARLRMNAHYHKPARNDIIFEDGSAWAKPVSPLCASMTESFALSITIDDYGTQVLGSQRSVSSSATGDGTSEISAYTTQNVRYFQIAPPDYHGIGSRIEWTASLHVVWKNGTHDAGCLGLRAINPGRIVDDRC